MNEWDTQNVTGHSDGVVRFWRMEFLQVPETPAPEPVEPDVPDCCEDKLAEGSESHNGDEDSSESDGDEPSLSQEPKPLPRVSTGTGSQPGSAVHRPKGYRWERQLVFRSKLTMHTAFDRKDNAHPAEITSLAISKDHSKILVGDGRGQPGRSAADHWVKDEVVDSCSGCAVRFSLTERRHHCRNCGQLFCQKCSRFQSEIKRLKISSPVRVCQNCFYNLQHERSAEDGCKN